MHSNESDTGSEEEHNKRESDFSQNRYERRHEPDMEPRRKVLKPTFSYQSANENGGYGKRDGGITDTNLPEAGEKMHKRLKKKNTLSKPSKREVLLPSCKDHV